MIDARLRIRLLEDLWVASVSQAFPEATFRLLAGVRTEDRAVELGELTAAEPRSVAEEVAAYPHVFEYELVEVAERRALATYETTDTGLYEFAEQSGFSPEYPVVVQDGWYEFDVTGTRATLDQVTDTLDELGQRYELLSLTHEEEAEDLLTPRQRETLNAALRGGYFEVPRGCTLADLAETLGTNKSTVSRTLRRAQNQVLRRYLTAPDRGEVR